MGAGENRVEGQTLIWLGVAAGALVIGLAIWLRDFGQYLWRLAGARRMAERFYAEAPGLTKGIRFGARTGSALDVYRPQGGHGHPVLVYVYGGSWNSGNKELYATAAQRLQPEGFVLVVPDYTTYPAAGYPTQSEEIAAALAWTFDNIAAYGGDPAKVVVVAQSAGAQVAGLCLTDSRFLAAHGHHPSQVQGYVAISGVHSMEMQLAFERKLRRSERYVARVMGGHENAAAASPMSFVGPHVPPALLIHGDADRTVPVDMSREFHRRLVDAGGQSELVIYARGGHSALLFDALAHNPSRLFNEIVAFARGCVLTESTLPALPGDPGHKGPATGA
jgi:acetyl esterase/lipase